MESHGTPLLEPVIINELPLTRRRNLLYVLVSISKNLRFTVFGLLNFSKNIIFYTKFSKHFKMTI